MAGERLWCLPKNSFRHKVNSEYNSVVKDSHSTDFASASRRFSSSGLGHRFFGGRRGGWQGPLDCVAVLSAHLAHPISGPIRFSEPKELFDECARSVPSDRYPLRPRWNSVV